LAENWELKKRLDENVSNPVIDKIYKKGISSGALGGKLLGAGAGGFILFYVKKNNHKNFLKELKKNEIIDFNFSDEGSKVMEI
jgi:D-glycero-alpha-D-manno-heptose-7-phosphate kinase